MTIKDILLLPRREALTTHIEQLDAAYFNLTNKRVCRVCPPDLSFMLRYLTNKYITMTQFELNRPRVIYKVQKGGSSTISNDKMTDELAIEFLSINPERIELFSNFPDNWKELIEGEDEWQELQEEDCCEDDDEEPCVECMRPALEAMKMKELKAEYPMIAVEFGQKKVDFINKILIHKLEEQETSKD